LILGFWDNGGTDLFEKFPSYSTICKSAAAGFSGCMRQKLLNRY
jgi:hypothetical protein